MPGFATVLPLAIVMVAGPQIITAAGGARLPGVRRPASFEVVQRKDVVERDHHGGRGENAQRDQDQEPVPLVIAQDQSLTPRHCPSCGRQRFARMPPVLTGGAQVRTRCSTCRTRRRANGKTGLGAPVSAPRP